MADYLRYLADMCDQEYCRKRFGEGAKEGPLVLPVVRGQRRRIVYTVREYDPLLDSSNVGPAEWGRIAEDIKESYEHFDGFVILHGTDTMSYTASALSFMLQNLGKSVVITGSQIPIFETGTDAKDNLIGALLLAGNYVIPEVCVFFGRKLFRGNRTIKVSSDGLKAFYSPNMSCLATVGTAVEVHYRSIFRPCTSGKFSVHTELEKNVGILRIIPNISLDTIQAFLRPPMRGVVLESFGSGNIPTTNKYILDALRKATSEHGILVVNCTQCTSGTVSDDYEAGSLLKQVGVTPGFDLTPEAALAKLMYVLSKDDWSLEEKCRMMECNLCGELTTSEAAEMRDPDSVAAVCQLVCMEPPKEPRVLVATLLISAVMEDDIDKLVRLKNCGADLSAVSYDKRTALHVACQLGKEAMVKYLLENNVPENKPDSLDMTPMDYAVKGGFAAIRDLLAAH